MTRRLFFALWPPRELADEIAPRAARLGLGGRLESPARLHLTLAFYRSCDTRQTEALMALGEGLTAEPFTLSIDHLSGFRTARSAWFGTTATPRRLCNLADELRPRGVDLRRFTPHITVIRDCVPPTPAALFPPLIWHVNEVCLVESGHEARPGDYRPLARWRLVSAQYQS